MALVVKYEGRTDERDVSGISTTIVYTGTRAECVSWESSHTIGTTYPGYGKLASFRYYQVGGTIYELEARFENANGDSGTSETQVTPPNYEFGEYSATMDGTMLSTPLEIHKNASNQFDYKCNWNQYLIGKYPKGGTAPAVPAWWSTLGADPSTGVIAPIPAADQQTYQWADYGTLPMEDGYDFIVLKTPTMAGYQSYDRALFTQTESARFRTYAEAVTAIARKLNKRGTPEYLPGDQFISGNWKCDRATVSWTGDYWLATLTWTYSPDGWNTTLYQLATG